MSASEFALYLYEHLKTRSNERRPLEEGRMKPDVRKELVGALDVNVPFSVSWETLRSLKDQGATAEEVYTVLESMYEAAHNARVRSGIADLMDCVVGFCTPEYRIW